MEEKQLLQIANFFLQTDEGKALLEKFEDVKEDIKEIAEKIPTIEEYTIRGKIYDKLTVQPLEGVNIKAILAKAKKTKTDVNGNFEIKIKVPILSSIILSKPLLYYSKEGFLPGIQELLTLNREIKQSLPTLNLLNIKKAAEAELISVQNQIDDKISKLNSIILSIPERVIIERKKSISKIITQIQTGLLPIVLGLLVEFGITKISQISQKVCPSIGTSKKIINKRNNVVKQLNKFYKSLILNIVIAGGFIALSKLFKSGKIIISNIILPLGAPVGVGVAYPIVSKLINLEDIFEELEEDNKKLNKQILMSLVFLIASIIFILILLNQIDKLLVSCYGNIEESIELPELEIINPELQELLIKQNEPNSPKVAFINGFEISTVFDDKLIGNIKRKHAVAKNKSGVILLEGEVSFSSSEQILIDELVFYIKSNNLKPF